MKRHIRRHFPGCLRPWPWEPWKCGVIHNGLIWSYLERQVHYRNFPDGWNLGYDSISFSGIVTVTSMPDLFLTQGFHGDPTYPTDIYEKSPTEARLELERKTRLEPTSATWIRAFLYSPRPSNGGRTGPRVRGTMLRSGHEKRSVVNWPEERKTRLELATPTLARSCSTNWAISAIGRAKIGINFLFPNFFKNIR